MKDNCDSSLFDSYGPFSWDPSSISSKRAREILSIKKNHGISSSYVIHKIKDDINEGRSFLESVILEYRINGNNHEVFHVSDFFDEKGSYDRFGMESDDRHIDGVINNMVGIIGERISRKITKHFLNKHIRSGRSIGLYSLDYTSMKKDYVVRNTEEYILKIKTHPSLILLKRTGKGKFGYSAIKEIDGFFAYEYNDIKNIFVMESKVGNIDVKPSDNIENLFEPLKKLYPEYNFNYILFASKDHVYKSKFIDRTREVKKKIAEFYSEFQKKDIGFMVFTFNESVSDFERLFRHIKQEYQYVYDMNIALNNRTEISKDKIVIYDNLGRKYMELEKKERGFWKQN